MAPVASKNFSTRVMKSWVQEDAPQGDETSLAVFGRSTPRAYATILAKQDLVVSGMDIVLDLLRHEFPHLRHERVMKNSRRVKKGASLMRLSGPVSDLLRAERIILNILQHLSGIATLTAQFVAKVRGTKAKILDTRKTLPGWRLAEKQAVRDGGGMNHRFSLSDAYMIKDNHIAAAGSAVIALERVLRHRSRQKTLASRRKTIIVEVTSPSQMNEVMPLKPDVIVLDNMTPAAIRECVKIRGRKSHPLLEISGGVNLDNVQALAKLGVERVSIGALTHSAKAVDISMEIVQI